MKALVFALATLALASFTSPAVATQDTIYACQDKKKGTIRIVSESTKCKKSEKKISWPATAGSGESGPPGPEGPPGPPGPEGPPGPAGGGTSLAAYGAFANATETVVSVVLGGISLPMFTIASFDVSFSGTTATIEVDGIYQLSYCVRITSPQIVSSRLVLNGSVVASSTIQNLTPQDTLCRSTIIPVSADSTVELQLYGLLGAVTLLESAGAELLIVRIAD